MTERKLSQTSSSQSAAGKSPNLSVVMDEDLLALTTSKTESKQAPQSKKSSSKNDMIVIKQTDDDSKKQTLMKKIKLLRGGHTTYDVHPNPKLSTRPPTMEQLAHSSNNSDNQQLNDMPKKKSRILGMPLICCTYFAAIYSLLAYGATSLLSIIELMMNNSTIMLPLYLLLVGYLLITLLSFLLIVAIQRESLNIILFWIISLSVFILPEIGLNIVLAENHYKWFQTPQGLYTLVCLVIRVTIDLFCIGIILYFHVNRTRRQRYLRAMLKPIKKKIISGQSLQAYHDIKAVEAPSSHIVAAAAGVSATNTLSMAIGTSPPAAGSTTTTGMPGSSTKPVLDDAKLISIHYPVIDAMPVPSLTGNGTKTPANGKQSQTPMAIGFNLLEKGDASGQKESKTSSADKSRNIEILKPGQENDFKTATRSTLAMPTLTMPISKVTIQPNQTIIADSNTSGRPETQQSSLYNKTDTTANPTSNYYFDSQLKTHENNVINNSKSNPPPGVASVMNNQYFITDEQIPQISATAHFCPFHHHYHPLYNQIATQQQQQQQQPDMSSALHLIWNGETGEYVPYNSSHNHQSRRTADYSKMMTIGQSEAMFRRNANNNYGQNLIRTKSTDVELGGGNRNTTRSPYDFRVSFAQQADMMDDERYNRPSAATTTRNYDMVPIEFRRAKRQAQQKQSMLTHQYSLNPDYLYKDSKRVVEDDDRLVYTNRPPALQSHGSQPGLYSYVLSQPSRQVYLPQEQYVNYYVDDRYTNRQGSQQRIYSDRNNYDFGYGFNGNYDRAAGYQTSNKNNSFNLSLNNLHRLNNDINENSLPVVSDEQPSATVWKGSACNCINIASCSQDNLNEFLHSKDCIFFQQARNNVASSTTRLDSSLEPSQISANTPSGSSHHQRHYGASRRGNYYAFAKNRSLEPNYMKLKSFSHSDYDIPRESVKLV